MRNSFWLLGIAITALLYTRPAPAETPVQQVANAADGGRYAYVQFYRSNDQRTRDMSAAIEEFVSQRSDEVSWVKVQVDDPEGSELVQRFNATRLPLPTVFGLAPNGAVTFVGKLTIDSASLQSGILTPRYSEMVKSLQQQKVAVVCLQPTGANTVPSGVQQLMKDRDLASHLHLVSASADDEVETRFFERMRVKQEIKKPVVLVFAPPGVYIGKFSGDVTGSALVNAIHKSGKCKCHRCQH